MVIREILQTLIDEEQILIDSIADPTPIQHPAVELMIRYHRGRASGLRTALKLITAIVEEKQELSMELPEIIISTPGKSFNQCYKEAVK